jgi:hypothetical protein
LPTGAWAERCGFACFIHRGAGTAAIDWEAASPRLTPAGCLAQPWEKGMLRLAASLADDIPVSLGEAVTGIDQRNAGLLVMRSSTPPDNASSPGYPIRSPVPRAIAPEPKSYPALAG